MKIITFAAVCGGTGKTTTAAAFAQAAAYKGKKILAVDLDPQGSLSFTMGADTSKYSSYDIMTGTPAAQAVQETAMGVKVIPASYDLATLKTKPGSANRLAAALNAVAADYDYICIDTPPTIGEIHYNALQASTDLIIPIEADIKGLQGLYQVADAARAMQQSNPALRITGFVITRYDSRPNLNRYMLQTIEDKAAEMQIPFLAAIRPGIAVREAQAMQQSLFDYAPNSKPAQDYLALYEKINKIN